MRLLRGILLGIAFWVLVFFEVSILMFGFGFNSPDIKYYIIHYILLTAFTIIANIIYFNGKKIKKGVIEGILFGVILVIVGIILDAVITVPLFIIPQGGSYSSFLLNLGLLIGYLWGIVLSGIIGQIKK